MGLFVREVYQDEPADPIQLKMGKTLGAIKGAIVKLPALDSGPEITPRDNAGFTISTAYACPSLRKGYDVHVKLRQRVDGPGYYYDYVGSSHIGHFSREIAEALIEQFSAKAKGTEVKGSEDYLFGQMPSDEQIRETLRQQNIALEAA